MAWIRVGQVTGETGSTSEFASDTSLGDTTHEISAEQTFTGAKSVKVSNTLNKPMYPSGLVFPAAVSVRASFGFRHNNTYCLVGTAKANLVKLMTGASVLAQVMVNSANMIEFNVGGVLRATKSFAECDLDAVNTWNQCGITYAVNGDFGYSTFYVNGQVIFTHLGAVTGNPTALYVAGVATKYSVGYWRYWTTPAYYDDLYVERSISAEPDLPPSSRRFFPRYRDPLVADILAQMTPVGAATIGDCIDDEVSDGDTTFGQASGAGLRNIIQLTPVFLPEDFVPRAQIVLAYARKSNAEYASTLKLGLSDPDHGEILGSELPLTTGYGFVSSRYEMDSDANAWNVDSVNATRMVHESSGVYI